MADASPEIRSARRDSIDVARGALLAGMVAVHVASAHGTSAQVNALHERFGIFLISAGFVWLSGFVIGLRGPQRGDGARAVRVAAQLLLAMVAYAVVLSVARHLLERISGGDLACAARVGWSPPLRFEDLGILLPIAIVQVLAIAVRRGRAGQLAVAVLAVASLLLLGLSESGPRTGLAGLGLDVLVRRTLTPFYSVCVFIALGLAGALAGASRLQPALTERARALGAIAGLALALAMGVPAWSRASLDVAYAAGAVPGAVATLLWWTAAILLFLRGIAGLAFGSARRALSVLGRNSLYVFVLHDFLLELDSFVRARLHIDKGAAAVAALLAADLIILVVAARTAENNEGVAAAARSLLLQTSQPATARRGSFAVPAALVFAGLLAVYTSAALARTRAEVLIDDFESADECPHWWSFGPLSFRRVGGVLDVEGDSTAVSGTGVYVQPEIGALRTLRLDVRGYGPGSGRLRIELFDDDNGNWEIEKDPRTYEPLYDDRFVPELPVDWTGWRELALPASAFRDDNPGVGDDVFNPERDLTSGGLLEMQLMVSRGSAESARVHLQIDNLRWTP